MGIGDKLENTKDDLMGKGKEAAGKVTDNERLEAEGPIAWPCPTEDHPGTPRLFEDLRFNTDVAEGNNTGFSDTRVDIDWATPKTAGPAPLWPLTANRKYAAMVLGGVLLLSFILYLPSFS